MHTLVISLGKTGGFPAAHEYAKRAGAKLVAHPLIDDILTGDTWRTLGDSCRVWTRHVLVYPKRNGKFARGEDVVDQIPDSGGRTWMLPSLLVPEEAIGRKNVGLVIELLDLELTFGGRIVVSESSRTRLVEGFTQSREEEGEVDPETRIPRSTRPEVRSKLAERKKRWLHRTEGAGVRPIVRMVGAGGRNRHDVYADYPHDSEQGILVETILKGL